MGAKVIDGGVELRLLAQGNTAEIYEYGGKILKLFRENLPLDAVKMEYRKAKELSTVLKNVPQVYELVNYQWRQGIIYEKVDGVDMIKAMLKEPGRLKEYSKKLAQWQFEIHKHKVDLGCAVKEKLKDDIEAVQDLSRSEKNQIESYLKKLPDGDTVLHFDFHPGNVLLKDDKPVVIDWMTACTGDLCADVARTKVLLEYGELMYTNAVVRKMAQVAKKYIGREWCIEYRKVSGVSDDEVEKWILPVAAGRLREWITEHERRELLKLVRVKLSKLERP